MVFDCGPIARATDCVCVPCCMDRGRKEYAADLAAAEQRVRELEAFKKWVHDYLDGMGIPTHPDGPHSKEGCRIGDRMDIVRERVAELESALADVLSLHDFSYLDKGIGVLTPDGAKLIGARAAHRAATG